MNLHRIAASTALGLAAVALSGCATFGPSLVSRDVALTSDDGSAVIFEEQWDTDVGTKYIYYGQNKGQHPVCMRVSAEDANYRECSERWWSDPVAPGDYVELLSCYPEDDRAINGKSWAPNEHGRCVE